MVPQLDFCPCLPIGVCPVKLLNFLHQFGDRLHDLGIIFDLAVVELCQTVEDLDIYRSLWHGHVIYGLVFSWD
jgi:hypothetical protein